MTDSRTDHRRALEPDGPGGADGGPARSAAPATNSCGFCGTANPADEPFCTSCGQSILASPAMQPAVLPPQSEASRPTTSATLPEPTAPAELKRRPEPAAELEREPAPRAPEPSTSTPGTAVGNRRIQAGIGAAALVILVAAWVIGTSGSAYPVQGIVATPAELSEPLPAAAAPVAETPAPAPAETMPANAPAERRAFRVTTRPSGARIWIDGAEIERVTPVEVPLDMNLRYRIRIEFAGHQTVDWAFTPAELADSTLASGQLFFPLRPEAIETLLEAFPASTEPQLLPSPVAEPAAMAPPVAEPAAEAIAEAILPPANPVRVRGPRMTAARVIDKWEPDFPDWAAEAELPGFVVLELVVDRAGRLRSSRVLRAVHPELEAMAIQATERWAFEPATDGGELVDAYLNVSVQFRRE